MKNKLSGVLIWFALILTTVSANAQDYKLSGKISDAARQRPIAGVTCILINAKDTTDEHMSSTDATGTFEFEGLKKGSYHFTAKRIGYIDIAQTVVMNTSFQFIGPFNLERKVEQLNDVVIQGQATPVVQKGDTTEMSASAYKVNPDANSQDLVQKMPGVTVDNGVIKAHGETIQRILIDGKNYFGEDPAMALQSLPAEVIDKVQIYNKMSDQAQFTGFDDGNSTKVMNITTRADRRNGTNGQFMVGSDFKDKYLASGRLNMSDGNRRLTLTAGSNNVNQQAFSTQDLLGVMGGSGGGGGRGGGGGSFGGGSGRFGGGNISSFTGRQSGLNTNHAFGLNYTNTFGTKLTVTGSYFFNVQDNNTTQLSNLNLFVDTIKATVAATTKLDTVNAQKAKYSKTNSPSTFQNYNHRFDLRVEYQADSSNSVIWAPRFSTQQNNRDAYSSSLNYNNITLPILSSVTGPNNTNGVAYTYASDLTLRHKFAKKGRTISLGIGVNGNVQNSNGNNLYEDTTHNIYLLNDIKQNTYRDTVTTSYNNKNQGIDSKTNSFSVSPNLSYTEPAGQNAIVQFSYNYTLNNNRTNRYITDLVTNKQQDSLSNVYKSSYDTHRGGITYRIRPKQDMMVAFGVDYQLADLSGYRTFPKEDTVNHKFGNFLPNAMLDYKISQRSNLRFMYRSLTNPPSVNQLQNVIIESNSSYSAGNPDLVPEYTHNAFANYRFSDPAKFVNFSFNVYGNYTLHSIGNATTDIEKNTPFMGDTLLPGRQLSQPVNLSNSWSLRVFSNYGFMFSPIKCNFTFLGGGGISKTPGIVDQQLSTTTTTTFTGGLVIASNISQNVDFTGSYNANYTVSQNSIESHLNSNVWYHSISLRSNFIWNGFVLQNSLVEQINRGLTGNLNQDYLQWNAGLGKKFLKNNSLEARFSIFDVLNTNTNISRTVSALAITDTRTNTLGRFYMFTLTYTLRAYKAEERGDRPFGGRGFRDGGPGGGGGGFRGGGGGFPMN